MRGRREEVTHYEIKHWAWTVLKQDGSTVQRFRPSLLHHGPARRLATKVKSECHCHGSAGHISPTHTKVTRPLASNSTCTVVKGHVLEHYPWAVPCFHEVRGTLGYFKCLPLTMFYIHTCTHTHTPHLTPLHA